MRIAAVKANTARQPLHDPHRLQADAHHLADQADDVLLVVGPVRIGADAAALVFRNLVLVNYPLQGVAVAEPALKNLRRKNGSLKSTDFQEYLHFLQPIWTKEPVRGFQTVVSTWALTL